MEEAVANEARAVSFFVPGTALPAGSKRAFVVRDKTTGRPRPVLTDTSGTPGKHWRAAIQLAAGTACASPLVGALSVAATFLLPRPRGHFAAAGGLRRSASLAPAVRPDLDKLGRMLLDSCTGILWRDDAQVTGLYLVKRYASVTETPGVIVSVTVWAGGGPVPAQVGLQEVGRAEGGSSTR